jgi:hypothetical protein
MRPRITPLLIGLLAAAACTPLKKGIEPDWEPASPDEPGLSVPAPASRAEEPPPPPPPAATAPFGVAPAPASRADAGAPPAPEPGAPDAAGDRAPGSDAGVGPGCSRETLVHDVVVFERGAGRSRRFGEWTGGAECPPGQVGAGCTVEVVRMGTDNPLAAGCIVTQADRDCRCRVRWWATAPAALRCTVTIRARRTCGP